MRHDGSDTSRSRSTCSAISFDWPYGLVADSGNDSSIGELFGTPYTVADELNTNCFTLRVAHHVEQHEQAVDIVAVVLDRLRHRFAHRLQRREVNRARDRVRVENTVERRFVARIGFVEGHRLPVICSTRWSDSRLLFTRLSITTTS